MVGESTDLRSTPPPLLPHPFGSRIRVDLFKKLFLLSFFASVFCVAPRNEPTIATPRRSEWLRQAKEFRREPTERQPSFSSTLKEAVQAIPPPAGGTPAAPPPPSATAPAPQPNPRGEGVDPSGIVAGEEDAASFGGEGAIGEDDGAAGVYADSSGDPDELPSPADSLGAHALADLPKMTMPLRNSASGRGSRVARTMSDQPPTLSSLAC